jgi:hypothetical protein
VLKSLVRTEENPNRVPTSFTLTVSPLTVSDDLLIFILGCPPHPPTVRRRYAMQTTLKTLVLKTAQVTSVKLSTPADRIGLGFGVAYPNPTDNLSLGQIPSPPNPVSEAVREREVLSAMPMPLPQQTQSGDATVTRTSSAGCPGSSGVSAGWLASRSASPFTEWRETMRAAAASRAHGARLHADPSRDDSSRDLRHGERLGRDCQSLRPLADKRGATREVVSAATAGK